MNHLTDEQLAARLDGSRSEQADRHLAECAECRARLAEFASLDESLGRALDHDPGEAYFATFADRVAARIAQQAAPATARAAAAPARRDWFAWWNSPRSLAWAGGALAVVAVAAIAVVQVRERGIPTPRAASEARAPLTAAAPPAANELQSRRQAAPEAGLSVVPPATRGGARPPSDAESKSKDSGPAASRPPAPAQFRAQVQGEPAPTPAPQVMARRSVAPQRLVQMKTLPNGEQVAVTPNDALMRSTQKQVRTPSGFVKPGATPMAPQPAMRDERAAGNLAPAPGAAAGPAERSFAQAPPPATPLPATVSAPRALVAAPQPEALHMRGGAAKTGEEIAADRGPTQRVCGSVHDPSGRALAGVVVSVAETGASTTTDAAGAFCVESGIAKPTLEAFTVGYRAYRGSAEPGSAAAPVALTLLPVETLAKDLGWGRSTAGYRSNALDAQRGDVGAARTSTQGARAATTLANRLRTVAAWQRAAEAWSDAMGVLAGRPADLADARFHVAEARMNAWRIGHTAAERAAADAAIGDYLAGAPVSPLRDLAVGWRKELAP